ncbi:NIPSNAP family containing protein [Mizugakiibacter sediminis]|uniref:NIPSNAP family containing protein n=1 Tax=Mizugakiibacter sediminis TaxID=1475481 RepID=A0A0K8QLD1_9GAMM|nr:NIPSNAP family protein [Mizugakiibacter sediminis]GAP65673.1 NIPSNAP family containing protein [Mizugakiibacter sediminis]
MTRSLKAAGYLFATVLVAAALAAATSARARTHAQLLTHGVVHQLRIYEIFDHNKQAFHDRFRDHAMRIMARYDFPIVATWESRHDDRTEFVYLLEWPDKETMQRQWAKFMADKEWSDIKKATARQYGDLVGGIQDRTLLLTDYSPHKELLIPQ